LAAIDQELLHELVRRGADIASGHVAWSIKLPIDASKSVSPFIG